MTTIILDGYNVIHKVPELERQLDRSLEAAREALVSLCRTYRASRGDIARLCVVFDGNEAYAGAPQLDRGGVTVLFTNRDEEADERILRLLREAGGRGRFTVVSDDVEIINNARAHGARAMSVAAFCKDARPAPARRASAADSADKPGLSPRDAHQITEEYRKHLEEQSP